MYTGHDFIGNRTILTFENVTHVIFTGDVTADEAKIVWMLNALVKFHKIVDILLEKIC
jgi:hypothetical protein